MTSEHPFIVMVDDDPLDAFAVRKALVRNERAVEFRHFKGGAEFIAFLEELLNDRDPSSAWPDVVLLDVNMPKMNGYEVVEYIRAHEALAVLPIVIFSTSETGEHVTRSYAFGANSHIVKPSSVSAMNAFADTLLNYWTNLVSPPLVRPVG